MKYINIYVSNNFPLNKLINKLHHIYLEISKEGNVIREIGFDKNNIPIHYFPSDINHYGKYGLFDLTTFIYDDIESDLEGTEFENFWVN